MHGFIPDFYFGGGGGAFYIPSQNKGAEPEFLFPKSQEGDITKPWTHTHTLHAHTHTHVHTTHYTHTHTTCNVRSQ